MEIKTNYDNVIVSNDNGNWSAVTSIDFGGVNVEFKMGAYNYWSSKNLQSISNCVITNTKCNYLFQYSKISSFTNPIPNITNGFYMFYECRNLNTFDAELTNLSNGKGMFKACPITSFTADISNVVIADYMFNATKIVDFICDMPKATSMYGTFSNCVNLKTFSANCSAIEDTSNTFSGCPSLERLEMIVRSAKSGLTQASFGISSTAPCQAYRYVDDLGDGTVRLVFTDTERVMVNNQLTMTDGSTYSCTGSSSISVSAQDDGIYHVTIINNTSGDIVLTGDSGVGATITLHQHERLVGNISMIYNGGMDGWIISSYTPDA